MEHFMEGKGEWKVEETAEYMNKLTRKQASTIFRARTRMMKVKGNYKNGYPDLKCRACKNSNETQNHAIAECPVLHTNGLQPSRTVDPFSENLNVLKETSRNIETVEEELKNCSLGGGQITSDQSQA